MWFVGVEVEQETSAPPPKKNPGSAPEWRSKVTVTDYDESIYLTVTLDHLENVS